MTNRFITIGAGAIVAAVALIGITMSSSTPAANAGLSTADPTSTAATPSATPCGGVIQESLGALQVPPTCTPVPVVKTATPTASATSAATDTAVPATQAPATTVPNTAVPATATVPGGGQLGAVSGPNTGTGDGTAAGGFPWLIASGMLLAALGIGSVGYGLRRRS